MLGIWGYCIPCPREHGCLVKLWEIFTTELKSLPLQICTNGKLRTFLSKSKSDKERKIMDERRQCGAYITRVS